MAFCLSSVPLASYHQQKDGTYPGLRIFLLMMMDLFLATGTPLSVSPWPVLPLMVQVSLLETTFITCLLYLAPTHALVAPFSAFALH